MTVALALEHLFEYESAVSCIAFAAKIACRRTAVAGNRNVEANAHAPIEALNMRLAHFRKVDEYVFAMSHQNGGTEFVD